MYWLENVGRGLMYALVFNALAVLVRLFVVDIDMFLRTLSPVLLGVIGGCGSLGALFLGLLLRK